MKHIIKEGESEREMESGERSGKERGRKVN